MLDLSNALLRYTQDLACLGLFGLAAFGLYSPAALALLRARRLAIAGALIGVVATLLATAAMTAGMAGSARAAVDPQALRGMVAGTGVGLAAAVRVVALLLTLALAIGRRERFLAGPAAVAVATLAWGGHAASGMGARGMLHLAVDSLHLLAAGIWVGALLVFVQLSWVEEARDAPEVHESLAQFAGIGSAVVAVLVATGIFNVGETRGWPSLFHLFDNLWGRLLAAKLALFATMLGLAALNRFRLAPGLLESDIATRGVALNALRRSLVLENAVALLVLALVAWLGGLDPTAR